MEIQTVTAKPLKYRVVQWDGTENGAKDLAEWIVALLPENPKRPVQYWSLYGEETPEVHLILDNFKTRVKPDEWIMYDPAYGFSTFTDEALRREYYFDDEGE